jgi:hypothetical protein
LGARWCWLFRAAGAGSGANENANGGFLTRVCSAGRVAAGVGQSPVVLSCSEGVTCDVHVLGGGCGTAVASWHEEPARLVFGWTAAAGSGTGAATADRGEASSASAANRLRAVRP